MRGNTIVPETTRKAGRSETQNFILTPAIPQSKIIGNTISITDCINNFLEPEEMDPNYIPTDEYENPDERYTKKTSDEKYMKKFDFDFTNTQYFFISPKRFLTTIVGKKEITEKINVLITTPSVIIIKDYKNNDINFEFFGTVIHLGETLSGGHYVYNLEKPKLNFNDSMVSPLSEALKIDPRVTTENGYIFLYKKI
jgi:ubiquitin C-terminal hydrolase